MRCLLKQGQELFLEGHLPVVLGLASDLCNAERLFPNGETPRAIVGKNPPGRNCRAVARRVKPLPGAPPPGDRIGPEGGQAVMFLLSAVNAAAGILSCPMRVDSPVKSVQALRPLYPLPSNQS